MEETWQRIMAWLTANAPDTASALQLGASEAEIADAERTLGITFPDDVRTFYLQHNGFKDAIGGHPSELLTLARAVDEWTVWKGLLDTGQLGYEADAAPAIQPVWWSAGWIPLTYDGAGNHVCLDMAPASGGQVGQLIRMWHDMPDRPLVAHSFREWLATFADDLESGRVVYTEEYGITEATPA